MGAAVDERALRAGVTADQVLAWLARRRSARNVDGMARYGIVATRAYGVSMTTMRPLVKRVGRDHALALALWTSGWHEARILAALVDDPAQVTRRQMNAWASSFENWAVCDTTCIHLFDRTPFAWEKARAWATARKELVKRAAFATVAGLAVHDRHAHDDAFVAFFPVLEAAAADPRPLVKKGVSWALRQTGKRNLALRALARGLAERLAASGDAATRWVGRDAARELARPLRRPRGRG